MVTANIDLPGLIEQFHDEDACRRFLEDLRWPEGITCPKCEAENITPIPSRNKHRCNSCQYQFSVRAGTVLQDSKLPLWKWFLATYMIAESRKGISSNQLKRMLGITYKSAWFLTHRIRDAMGQINNEMLTGTVEVDETYVGGKSRMGRRGPLADKAIVMGAIERGGEVRMEVVTDTRKKTMHGFINDHVADEAENIYTDSHVSYIGIGDENTTHESVNHRREEWVRGKVHTNTIEGVWSLLERSIVGSYHHLSAYHLPKYLGEMEWRYNNRNNPYIFRETLRVLVTADPLTYRDLVD